MRQENQEFTRGSIFASCVCKYNYEHGDDEKISLYKCSWNKCMYVDNLFGIPVGFFINVKLSKKTKKKYCLPELLKAHFDGMNMPDFLSYDKLKDLV
jgi:hypothetical protein